LEKNETVDKACNLKLCMFHDYRAPRLFVNEPTDGAGHRMKSIIEGMIVAAKNGMNFGGVRANPNDRVTEHRSDFRDLVDAFFGCHAGVEFYPSKLPNFRAEFNHVAELERSQQSFKAFQPVMLWEAQEWEYNWSVPTSAYFTTDLRSRLGRRLWALPSVFDPQRPAVAIHVRRGDLNRGHFRATPDSYYFNWLERIRQHLPNADVHVWSSTQLTVHHGERPWWNSSDFDGYRKRGVHVHLDDPNLLTVWAHLSRAQVFVMAQSAFSYVPAVLNLKCVIFPGFIRRPLDNWLDGSRGEGSADSELRACLARAGGRG